MKSRSATVFFIAMAFTGMILPDWVHPVAGLAAEDRIGAVTANVNLRKTPSLQGDVVAGLQKGLPVKVYGEKDGWYRVSARKNYMLFNGWVYNRYVEIVSTDTLPAFPEATPPQPLPAAAPTKPPPAPVKASPPPVVRTPTPKTAPASEKGAPAIAPQRETPAETVAEPATQKSGQPRTASKVAPTATAQPADYVRLLLSVSPLLLAIIALLVAVRAFRAARTSGRKTEKPAAPSPPKEPEVAKPVTSPENPPVNEKRRAPRLNRLVEVDFAVDGKFFRGFINNLSETGVYVDTPETFTVGREITISCPVIDTGGYSKRIGLIVRLTETGIAVHFQQNEGP